MDNKINFLNYHNSKIDSSLLDIVLIAHVREPRGYVNSQQLQCSQNERFTVEEFYDIYQGIVNAGFYIKYVFFNELDFISDYTQNPSTYKNSLVYNLARNGAGKNKKTIIPSFCEMVGLKYTTSSSFTCAMCRNKYYFTSLLQANSVPVPQSWFLLKNKEWINHCPPVDTYVICKPASESASQGVDESGIFTIKQDSFDEFVGDYIIQEYIDGCECEVPIIKMGNEISVLPPVGIDLFGKNILNDINSDENNYGFYQLYDVCSKDTIEKIQDYAKKTFKIMDMDVYGRVDFRVDKNGNPYVFDISTTPYTTKHSSFAYSFEKMGLKYSDIYTAIINSAIVRYIKN